MTTITRSNGGVTGPQVTLAYDAADRRTGMTRSLGTVTIVTDTGKMGTLLIYI